MNYEAKVMECDGMKGSGRWLFFLLWMDVWDGKALDHGPWVVVCMAGWLVDYKLVFLAWAGGIVLRSG